ncbi:8647_t:CDS:2, partial [Gigaspora margarita]
MDCLSEPVNHDDTSVSPKVGDDVSELSLEKMVPTGSNYLEPSKKFLNKKNKGKKKATVLAADSCSQLQRQPPDPFRNCELKTASGIKNAFDLMRPQKQKNADHNDVPNVSVRSKVYIDNIQHGVYNIEMVDRKACDIKVKTSDSIMALWRYLNLEHEYTKNSMQQ